MKLVTWTIAVGCVLLMIGMTFQPAAACHGPDGDVMQKDIFMDQNGNIHMAYAQMVRDSGHGWQTDIFYQNNIGMQGHGHHQRWNQPVQISDSETDSVWPQVSGDSSSGIIYVSWIEEGFRDNKFWYAGSDNDGVSFTQPRYGAPAPWPVAPNQNMVASNGVLTFTWRPTGSLTIEADIDSDLIPDIADERPMVFDIDVGMSFDADLIEYSSDLGVVVAIQFLSGTGTLSITAITPDIIMESSTHNYFEVTFNGDGEFIAIIKCYYDLQSLPDGTEANHLRMYWLKSDSWWILMDENEATGVNMDYSYVWAQLNHFSNFVVADATLTDSDCDGLSDGKEMNIDYCTPQTITNFKMNSGDYRTWTYVGYDRFAYHIPAKITVPVWNNAYPYVNLSYLKINGYAFPNFPNNDDGTETIASNGNDPCIWENLITWVDISNAPNNLIIRKNTVNGVTEQISSGGHGGTDSSPVIWGDWVVWQRENPPGVFSIYGWNDTDKQEVLLTEGFAPSLWGNHLACLRNDGIVKYDILTKNTAYIRNGAFVKVKVWGDFIVYSDHNNIWSFDLISGVEQLIFTEQFLTVNYDFAGTNVVYYKNYERYDLYAKNLISGEIVTLQIHNNTGRNLLSLSITEDTAYWIWRDFRGSCTLSRGNLWTGNSFYMLGSPWGSPLGTVSSLSGSPPDHILSADLGALVWSHGSKIYLRNTEKTFINGNGYDNKNIVELYVGDEPTPVWSSSGMYNFTGIPEISYHINSYIAKSYPSGGNGGTLDVPLYIRSRTACIVNLTNLVTYVTPILDCTPFRGHFE